MPEGTLEIVGRELARAIQPVEQRLATGQFAAFAAELGLPTPPVVNDFAAVGTSTASVVASVARLPPIIAELKDGIDTDDNGKITRASADLLRVIVDVATGIKDLAEAIDTAATSASTLTPAEVAELQSFATAFPRRLLDFVVIEYMRARVPEMLRVLMLVGLVDDLVELADPANPASEQRRRRELHLERFVDLFTNPEKFLRDVYGWGDPGFDGELLFQRIVAFLGNWDVPAAILRAPGMPTALECLYLRFEADPASASPRGLVIRLRVPGATTFTKEYRLTDLWKLSLTTEASFQAGIDMGIKPPFALTLAPPTGSASLAVTAGIVAERADGQPMVLLGQAGGSGLFLGRFALAFGGRGTWSSGAGNVGVEPAISAEVSGGRLVVDFSESDGFIQTIASGVRIDANLGMALDWSPSTGVRFEGSGGIEIAIPTHIQLGPLEISRLYLKGGVGPDGIPIELSAGFAVRLGPLQASVDRIGITAKTTFPADDAGNLGAANLAFGFKPPNGVGLSVDAGVVRGGGYLYLDFDKGEYAGALELTLANFIALKAIGLINTKRPDGSPGFSLLIIVTAEFGTGIQLGWGFTLLGVGGLLGLNRTVALEPLANGVRTGGVERIMFPRDVVANAPQIISDLRTFFPMEDGKFLIGPMGKLGWGTPALITLSLGIIIEIPGNIAILGVLKLALPTPDDPLVVIQVAFIGAIEFDKKRVWFFASLFGSRVLFMTIEGEMGVLAAFGDDAAFVISVGGFHPAFTPPPMPFPVPGRIAISILNESWGRIRVAAYFAVTSNTVQFGARAELFFDFAVISIEGYLGFDALIQFSPFYFIISLSAGVSLKVFGIGLFSIRIEMSLEGPTPWRARGRGYLQILFFEVSADFDVTWGEAADTTLPPVPVMPLLLAELDKREAWTAILPEGRGAHVSLRAVPADTPRVVLHPLGTLRVTQRAVPLDLTIEKVGTQAPSDANRFRLEVDGAALTKTGDVNEQFAPAQFLDMDDASKLARPSYEAQHGGIDLAGSGAASKTSKAVTRKVRYEEVILDDVFPRLVGFVVGMIAGIFAHFLRGSSVARSPLSMTVAKRLDPFPKAAKVAVEPGSHVVAFTKDNTRYTATSSFASDAAARDFVAREIARRPELAGEIHVIAGFEEAA